MTVEHDTSNGEERTMIPTGTSSNESNDVSGTAQGAMGQARDFGRDMKDQASDFTQNVAEVLKTQAGNLAESAKDVAADAGGKLRTSVREQKAAGADYIGNIANIVRRTASEFDTDLPQAGHYIRKAAAELESVSDAMRNREMSQIIGNVQDFARRQPTAFFGAAVLVGFAAVRFLKSGSGTAGVSEAAASKMGGRTTGM